MRVKVNGTNYQISIYDDIQSILKRYALKRKSLPKYFRSVDKVKIHEGANIKVKSIIDDIGDLTLEDLANESTNTKILSMYPLLRRKDIFLKWLDIKKYVPESVIVLIEKEDILKKIDRYNYPNIRLVKSEFEKFLKNEELAKKKLGTTLNKFENIVAKIEKAPRLESEKFIPQQNVIYMDFQFVNGITIIDVFDAINVSDDIPFLHLVYQGKEMFKVYRQNIPPKKWLKEKKEDGIYIKILSVPYSKLSSRGKKEDLYSSMMWSPKHKLTGNIKIDQDITIPEIKGKILLSLANRIPSTKMISDGQMGVNGTFSIISNIKFNKAILADMIFNSDVMKYFTFLDEAEKSQEKHEKSILDKRNFIFFYKINQDYDKNGAYRITIIFNKLDGSLKLRIKLANTVDDAEKARDILVKLFSYYILQYDSVIKEYVNLFPNAKNQFKKYLEVAKIEQKKDRKTKRSLGTLKSQRPDIFVAGYASVCESKRQPFIIEPKNVKKYIKTHGNNGVMKFKDDYYGCKSNKYNYPGLKKTGKYIKQEYQEKYPQLPCCYTTNQYTTQKGTLRKKDNDTDKIKTVIRELKVGEQIYSSKKIVPQGRFGNIPFYLLSIVENSGYKKVRVERQYVYPIFTFGVLRSPDSIIHCMEMAFNKKYNGYRFEVRKDRVMRIRRRLSELKNFGVAKQELYDYTDEDIRDILLKRDSYLDPEMWISLLEKYYECNILMFKISDKNPNGDVIIPRHSYVYLSKLKSPDKPTIIIIRKKIGNQQPQCEIISEYNPNVKQGTKFQFAFNSKTKFIHNMTNIYNKSVTVYDIGKYGYTEIIPIKVY